MLNAKRKKNLKSTSEKTFKLKINIKIFCLEIILIIF